MKKIAYTILSISPALTLAQNASFNTTYFQSILTLAKDVIRAAIPLAFGLALVYFFYGVAKYILNASSDAASAKKGKDTIIYGIIAIAVIASVWGLVAFLQNIFGVSSVGAPSTLPTSIPGLN